MHLEVALHTAQRVVRQALGLVLVTIALNVVAQTLKNGGVGFLAGLAGLIALMFGIVAVFRAGEALGYPMLWRIGLALLIVLPLVNIVTLIVMDVRLTRRLRTT